MLGALARADPKVVLLLLADETREAQDALRRRLVRNSSNGQLLGVPEAQLVLTPFVPHEVLLSLFRHARFALDPSHFGGDGTSREALEMGCPVVTRPAGGLGSRWTASLYFLLGLEAHPGIGGGTTAERPETGSPQTGETGRRKGRTGAGGDGAVDGGAASKNAATMGALDESTRAQAAAAAADGRLWGPPPANHANYPHAAPVAPSAAEVFAPVARDDRHFLALCLALAHDSGGYLTRLRRFLLGAAHTQERAAGRAAGGSAAALFEREDAVRAWARVLDSSLE